jgi:hypothetical protein
MPVMPKGRYRLMTDYMGRVGTHGTQMMYRTCTVQVNLDYSSEADMVKKLRVAIALQPVATALFASSPFFEGKVNGHDVAGVSVYVFKEEDARSVALAFLDETALLFGPRADVEAAVTSRSRGETPFKKNATLMALVEKVRPGSTFWMVGDQSLLAGMPTSVPGSGDGAMIQLPALQALTVTGDLDPQVSLNLIGEAKDELAARNLADVVRGFVALMSLQAQQKPELQQLASAFTVATEANRVLVSARVPYEMLDALQAKAVAR